MIQDGPREITRDREALMPIEHEWQNIQSAPDDCDLELAVIESEVPHALVFPCRRRPGGWIHSETRAIIRVEPTHWRLWQRCD